MARNGADNSQNAYFSDRKPPYFLFFFDDFAVFSNKKDRFSPAFFPIARSDY